MDETKPVGVEVGEDEIPGFPWPIPKYSAHADIDLVKLPKQNHPLDTLGDVSKVFQDAFNQAGYAESSYYSVPGGFAIVSRLEAILEDGSPAQARWPSGYTLSPSWSLVDLIRYLFTAKVGYYRIIVFVITSRPIRTEIDHGPDPSDLAKKVFGGADRLPTSVNGTKLTKEYHCRAFIYEFKLTESNSQPDLISPSPQDGKTHLLKSQLWTYLGG